MEPSEVQAILKGEKIELESTRAVCLPYKGLLPFDGNIYSCEFSPGCLILLSATDTLFGNRVLGAGIENGLTGELVKELINFFRSAKRPRFLLQACPLVLTDENKMVISENNGSLLSNWIKLVKYANEVKPLNSNIPIREMNEDEREYVSGFLIESFSLAPELIAFFMNVLGKNGWTCYVAESNGKVAGTGSIYINGNIAELGIAATIKSERGKGIQSALIAMRELHAIEKKCESIFVETVAPTHEFRGQSYLNMKRLGYTELYRRGNYLFQI